MSALLRTPDMYWHRWCSAMPRLHFYRDPWCPLLFVQCKLLQHGFKECWRLLRNIAVTSDGALQELRTCCDSFKAGQQKLRRIQLMAVSEGSLQMSFDF